MDKNKRLLIILAAVVILFLVLIIATLFKPHPKQAVRQTGMPLSAPQQEAEKSKERKTTSFRDWGRDPFSVGSVAAERITGLALTGIMFEEGNAYCIINSKIVKVGDKIAGGRVVEIKKDSVSVQIGDEIKVLKVGHQ